MTQIRIPITGAQGPPGPPGEDGAPGVDLTGPSFHAKQIRLGTSTAAVDAVDTITDPLHTQMVFAGPNVNMIGLSNTDGNSTQWGGSLRSNMFSLANSDGGIRWWMNTYQDETTFGAFESDRPSATWALDSAGSPSYKYTQPADLGPSAFGSAQTYIINAGAGGVESAIVSFMLMQAGKYMRFHTCSVMNDPQPVIEFQPDQTIWWYQKMISPLGTAARAPFRIRSGVAPTVPVAGDIWMQDNGLYYCRPSDGVTIGPIS